MSVISDFHGQFFFLSNFYRSPITEHDITYPTMEHYFQAQKADNAEAKKRIASAETPSKAKYLGRSVHLVPDWEIVKLAVMRDGLQLKFAEDSQLAWALLSTGDAYLIEGNSWGDRYWGVDGHGSNWLGNLLMARRAELRAG
jgi:ribA/ribD-fused uncharacterized protein